MGMAQVVQVHAAVRGALHADLHDARHGQALSHPAREVLVRGFGQVVVQQGMVQRRDRVGHARAQRLDLAAGESRPAGRQRRADGGEIAVAMQAMAAVGSGQGGDAAGRLEAG